MNDNMNGMNLDSTLTKIIKAFIAFWFLWVIFCMSLMGVLIWVAYHFISKVW